MNLGHEFVIEVPEERETEFLDLLKTRPWNYPIVKKMSFGWFITSLDGTALTMPSDYGWDDFLKPGLIIRRPTQGEQREVCQVLNHG